MSLLDRFFRGGRHRAHADGIALLEQRRFAEAVAVLREVAREESGSGASLVSYHFRQALVGEGRRLLRAGEPGRARPLFDEAVAWWDRYPDLHCLAGTAAGLAGDWERGLNAARAALRLNPDYVEARLLEAAALAAVGKRRDAADALNALAESGRRVGGWVVERLARPESYTAADVPDDLAELLATALGGESEKEEVAAAVALCRAGRWEEGLSRFAELVERRPNYPDYRMRHAAALFQLGHNDEALTEVEAALALNEDYRLARDLKALILSDSGRVAEARELLATADAARRQGGDGRTHEDLFGAYLRGVLALLTGRPADVLAQFGGWRDLVHGFGRAELLLAAAEDLTAAHDACRRRLEALAREWTAESVYTWLLACHHLTHRRYRELAELLSRWPGVGEDEDWWPLYLEGHLAVCQGRRPALPDSTPPPRGGGDALPRPTPEAWRFLAARVAFLGGDDAECLAICRELAAAGARTERLGRLELAAASGLETEPEDAPDDWPAPPLPDSCLAGRVMLARRRSDAAADRLLAEHVRLHPENPLASWLRPGFWLLPVRGWIA